MSEKDDVIKKYEEDVQWLKEHVAPDDIYDFAHQMRICGEHILQVCFDNFDLVSLLQKDKQFNLRASLLAQISRMQKMKINGMIDTSISTIFDDNL